MLQPLTADQVLAAVELDQRCLGGLWTAEGYQRELDSSNAVLLTLQTTNPVEMRQEGIGSQRLEAANLTSGKTAQIYPSYPTPAFNEASHGLSSVSHSALVALGCLWMILEEAHITILMVDPVYRGQGLGQAMLWSLLGAGQQQGMSWATLEVRPSNTAAIALYQKFGFQSVGTRKRYYQNPEEDALILWNNSLKRPDFDTTLAQWQLQVSDRLHQSGWHLNLDPALFKKPESSS
ncbi:ribosomal protein S18-alanine N-acetyltransferase [Leptolyngbya sp. AN02str]|uniref:ribosomal protein S18-alanine N-acetyltransferase n=1 Tax=Leptolyngbya sp. AN02str TaxID=3423363 RepID=UPI003D31E9F0